MYYRLGKREHESSGNLCDMMQADWIRNGCGFRIGYQTPQEMPVDMAIDGLFSEPKEYEMEPPGVSAFYTKRIAFTPRIG